MSKGGHKRAVPVKGLGPKVPSDAKTGHKYSTGSTGRNKPAGFGKRRQSKTNP